MDRIVRNIDLEIEVFVRRHFDSYCCYHILRTVH